MSGNDAQLHVHDVVSEELTGLGLVQTYQGACEQGASEDLQNGGRKLQGPGGQAWSGQQVLPSRCLATFVMKMPG